MLTIVSWNIQYGKGVDSLIDLCRIADVVKQDGLPDVLCLQEVSRNDPETANGSDQVIELQKLFPNYEIFYGASHDRSGGKDGGRRQFGNLILIVFTLSFVVGYFVVSLLNHVIPQFTKCYDIIGHFLVFLH